MGRVRLEWKEVGMQRIGNLAFFTALSFVFLDMALSRARMASEAYDIANKRLVRSIEDVRLANLAFGESSASVALLQGNLVDIQDLVEQATREVGAAQVEYLQAVEAGGVASIEAALAQADLNEVTMEWGDVLRIGAPLVNDATTALNSNEDSLDAVERAQRAVDDSSRSLRITLAVTALSIVSQIIPAYLALRAAQMQAAAAGAVAQGILGGPAGWAKLAIGVGVASATIAAITALVPFQMGGLVTRPTIGILGERGPEAVIPLDKMRGGGREDIHVNLFLDGEQIEKAIVRRNRT